MAPNDFLACNASSNNPPGNFPPVILCLAKRLSTSGWRAKCSKMWDGTSTKSVPPRVPDKCWKVVLVVAKYTNVSYYVIELTGSYNINRHELTKGSRHTLRVKSAVHDPTHGTASLTPPNSSDDSSGIPDLTLAKKTLEQLCCRCYCHLP
jgi:hypothetical protein